MGVKIIRKEEMAPQSKALHEGYAYTRFRAVSREESDRLTASVYEVPPGKAAYPTHYHTACAELFYILSGTGELSTPQGKRRVTAGDILYFPPDESGAHKLVNASDSEMLAYLDVDTLAGTDVCYYPDSGKVGVIVAGRPGAFFTKDSAVDYYQGE